MKIRPLTCEEWHDHATGRRVVHVSQTMRRLVILRHAADCQACRESLTNMIIDEHRREKRLVDEAR